MALLGGLEIYIPPQAEVQSIPLNNLPSSVLRAMGISPDQVTESSHSPQCLWICPAHIQRKGQKQSSLTQGITREDMLKTLGVSRGVRAGSAQVKMSFVTTNCTAYRVLKETLPTHSHRQRQTCSSETLPQATLANSKQDAVIVYGGNIYLSVKKCKKTGAPKPQPAAQLSPLTLDPTMENSKEAPVTSKQLKRKQQSCKRAVDGTRDVPRSKISLTSSRTPSPAPVLSQRLQTSHEEQEPSQSPDLSQSILHNSLHQSPSHSRCTSVPSAPKQDFEYDELVHLENIAQMKAKLMRSNELLSNLQPTNK